MGANREEASLKREKVYSSYELHTLLGRCADAIECLSEIVVKLDPEGNRIDPDGFAALVSEINKAIGR